MSEHTPTVRRWNVIDDITGEIVNVILWDGVTEWVPPEGTTAALAGE